MLRRFMLEVDGSEEDAKRHEYKLLLRTKECLICFCEMITRTLREIECANGGRREQVESPTSPTPPPAEKASNSSPKSRTCCCSWLA